MLDRPLVADFLVHRALAFGIRLPRGSQLIIPEHRPDRLLKHTFRSGDAETLVFAQPAQGFEAGQHVECIDEVGIAGNLFRKQAQQNLSERLNELRVRGIQERRATTVDLLGKQERLIFFKADGASIDQSERAGLRRRRLDDRNRLLDAAERCFSSPQNLASPQRVTSRV